MTVTQHTEYGAPIAVTVTGLNPLASGARALSNAIDNRTTRFVLEDIQLDVTFAAAPVVGTFIKVYLLRSLDGGTVYADGSDSVVPASRTLVGKFDVRAITTVHHLIIEDIPIPGTLYKYLLDNQTAQSTSGTSALTRVPHGYESV